ncbi:unnamed protein product [Dibothriocephalus latus]|uniref:Uncharacterized protein n=1 Tax=Dibothriocephalus latus TaxID=60516 RepID=A0A3P7M825_DIBLA|nr:unnamed protein product [Dibothriocephalus latus]
MLSGLLNLVDDDAAAAASGGYEQATVASEPSLCVSPPEKAAVAIQGLVRKALEDPSSREVAAGLLPALLPILIDRALSTAAPCTGTLVPSDSRRFALDLLNNYKNVPLLSMTAIPCDFLRLYAFLLLAVPR